MSDEKRIRPVDDAGPGADPDRVGAGAGDGSVDRMDVAGVTDDIAIIRAFIGSWPKDTVGHDFRERYVAALDRVAARLDAYQSYVEPNVVADLREDLQQAEQERDEAEGAMKVWRNRTMTAEARVQELTETLREAWTVYERATFDTHDLQWSREVFTRARAALAGSQAEEQPT